MLFFPVNKPWGEAFSRGTVAEEEASRWARCDPPCSINPSLGCPCLTTLESRSQGCLAQTGGQRSFPIRFHLRAHLQLSRNCPSLPRLKPSFCRQKAIYCQINNAAACRAGSGQHRDMELRFRIITGVYHISGGYYITGTLPCTKTAACI